MIQSVRKSSPTILKFYGGHLVSSQHKRKLRCLELCPANDQLVVTRYALASCNKYQMPIINALALEN